eukprot:11161508-Alexandrium_andersonii.AAC.1
MAQLAGSGQPSIESLHPAPPSKVSDAEPPANRPIQGQPCQMSRPTVQTTSVGGNDGRDPPS